MPPKGKGHGTDWAFRTCTSGPDGGRCGVCRTAIRAQRARYRAKVRQLALPEPPPVPPEIARLREQVACVGCGAVRVSCPAPRGQAQTRIDHKDGCPVAGISEDDDGEVAA